MRGRKEVWIGLGILVILVLIIIGIKFFSTNGESIMESNLKTVYVATGGGHSQPYHAQPGETRI